MRLLLAPDKFKGSLPATGVIEHLARGLRDRLPGAQFEPAPIADGGEGTLDAAVGCGFTPVPVTVRGPLGAPVQARYAIADGAVTDIDGDRVAVVELAAASGLAVLPHTADGLPRPDALAASSIGTGELIRAALDDGADTVVVAVGGSACTDGGAGLISGLGARLLDADGGELALGGGPLTRLDAIDLSRLDPRVRRARFLLASDVTSPLLGERGAAAVFGPQKGATPEQVDTLDAGLRRFRDRLGSVLGSEAAALADVPGAGAAGGVGYAALAVLGAEPRPGIEVVLEVCRLAERLPGTDLVITGEGSLDHQSLEGKAPIGVAALARAHGIEVIAVCGRTDLSPAQFRAAGISAVYPLTDLEPDPARCIAEAPTLLHQLGQQIAAQLLSCQNLRPI